MLLPANSALPRKVQVVRGADDLKVAQRFIAGVRSGDRISPRSGRLKTVTEPRAVATGS